MIIQVPAKTDFNIILLQDNLSKLVIGGSITRCSFALTYLGTCNDKKSFLPPLIKFLVFWVGFIDLAIVSAYFYRRYYC